MQSLIALIALVAASTASAQNPDILTAIDLPLKAQEARAAGIPDDEVAEALDAAKAKDVHAGEAATVLGEAAEASKKDGRIDNLGGFVKEQLESGVRGKELSEAIRAEHRERAMGKPEGKPEHAGGRPEDKGKPDHAGGRPEDEDEDEDDRDEDHSGDARQGKEKPEHADNKSTHSEAKADHSEAKSDHAGGPPKSNEKSQNKGHKE